jgi:uncharacterized repeat protein (TIGR01451 family)
VGESVTYTVTVDNHGPSVANGVTLTDTLPAGTTLVSATATAGGSCTPGSGAVTCVWSAVAANPTPLPTVAVQVAANNPGTIINSATVTATGGPPDPTPANNTSMESTTVTGQGAADLEITKSAPATATAGAAAGFDYGLTVLNHGQFDEPSFTVTDTLPAGVSLVNTSPGCSANANTIQCTGGPLAAGATAAFTIQVQVPASVPAGTVLNNQATVTGSLPDPNAANNSTAVTTTVAARADLGLGKALSTLYGTQATYELTITTSGPSDAAGVLVSDQLPADLTFVSADQSGTFDPQTRTVTWNLGTVPPSSQPIRLHLTIQFDPQRTAPVSNTACVASATQDPAAGNNCSTVTAEVVADLRVDKTAPTSAVAGDPAGFDYHVTVSNAGPLAQAFTVTDTLPAVLTFVGASAGCSQASGTVTCAGGPLAAGGSASFDIHVRVPASAPDGTILHNVASVTGQAVDPNLANNQAATTTTVVAQTDLSVTKTAPSAVEAGALLQYDLSVANAGPSDANSVVVTDQLPDGTTFVAADQGGAFDQQRGQVNWSLGAIPASALTVHLHLTVRVAPDRTTALSNTACVSSSGTTPRRCATVTTPVTSAADVSVSQTAPAKVELGDPFAVTATVTNIGPSTATGVVLTETLQPQLEYLAAQPCGFTGTIATCAVGSLSPGASQTITFHVRGVMTCTITGTSGDDLLVGTDRPDTICGGAGDDTIFGLGGDDHLYGYGPPIGEDLSEIASVQTTSPDPAPLNNIARTTTHVKGATEAAPDRDTIDGGPGNDFISGDYGSDRLSGGPGDDQIWGDIAGPAREPPPLFPPDDLLPSPSNGFSDPVCNQPGDLSQSPSDGSDTINGNAGNDEIHGQGGNDGGGKRQVAQGELEGGGGRDHICGGLGDDHLDGGPDSRNILNGGPGNDWCSGGPKPGDYWVSCQRNRWGWNGHGR